LYKKSLFLDDSFAQAVFERRERRRMEERVDGQCGREEVRDVVERAHIGE
jgi:hypothetical protein